MTGPADPASIEARLARAGLPPLPRSAWLEIDLNRLRGNVAALRAALPTGARLEAVVKADAYGHGAVPLARVLVAAGVDGLAVAAFDEALELRAAGIRAPILCLYSVPPAVVASAMRQAIAIAASDPTHLERMLGAAAAAWTGASRAESGTTRRPRSALRIQLEVETGLGRAGLLPEDVAAAADRIARTPGARLAGVWSHLQAADDAARTDAQDARFALALGHLRDAVGRPPHRHLAASAGLLGRAVPGYDGVRIGLATYGLLPDDIDPVEAARPPASRLLPILSLHARPVRVADLPAETGISYGPSFTTSRPSRIATLPLGYGDGFPRLLSNRAQVLVRGQRVPLVGNVAMDAVMVDVTTVAGPPITVDDEFVLFGEQGSGAITVEEVARLRTTNSWETVTAMARRLPRVYHADSAIADIRTLVTGRYR